MMSSNIRVPYFLTPHTLLPSEVGGEPIIWHSSLRGLVDARGHLTPPKEGWSDEFKLIATTLRHVYSFKVRMLGTDCQWLAGYTRQQNENPNEYSGFVANSLHLSLSSDGKSFKPLNHNYGILFAKADYSITVEGKTQLLEKPRMFRLADNGFGILAIPLDYRGQVTRRGELLYFETTDFVHYEEKGVLKLTDSAILEYSCELDGATLLYRINWTEKDGEAWYRSTKDFVHINAPQQSESIYSEIPVSSETNLDKSAQLLAITPAEANHVRNKLGRIGNVSIEPPRIHVASGSSLLDLNFVRAKAIYSDGSYALKRIEIDPEEFSAMDLTESGEYTLRARVVRKHFPYPMMSTRPDPYILFWKGRYYFISTDDDGQKRIYIRSALTLEELEDGRAEEVLLWDGNVPHGERHGQHWAPELHVICGKLYCFLAISVNGEWHGVQAHVAVLEGDDPMVPNHWGEPRRVLNRQGEVLANPYIHERCVTLDMTYFEHKGKSYVCWSQAQWFGEEQERASLYLATVNPQDPWRLTCPPARICRNEYGWDRNGGEASGVSEGAFVLVQEHKLFMVFSGSSVGPNYAVGLLEMDASSDPMDPDSWKKWNYPVMHSHSLPGQYGPGHNMFMQDHYGDWYHVYHACGRNGGFRHASIHPIHFRLDGSPILDIKDEEELLPELEWLNMTIKVE